ncbi:MAG TPA: hypothetical protein VGI39_33935 [Polyangiaceae bacterium]|jgi:hypothetical protein
MVKNMAYWKVALAAALVGGVALGCNAVLGITKANELDLDGGAPDAGTADAGTPCEQYCATIMQNCTGQNLEYTDIGTCQAMCKHFETGTPGDTTQDSLACRTYHSHAAAMDPNYHCRHAGPLGGEVCGTDLCESFCALGFALCQELLPYDGGQLGCQSACTAANFPYMQVDAGDIGYESGGQFIEFTSGNTFNCRIYHLEAAYEPNNDQARTTHCPHIAVTSPTCTN